MCLAELQHFYPIPHHAVRGRIATEPFTSDHTGDYLDSVSIFLCNCSTRVGVPAVSEFAPSFEQCTSHNCCATWYHVTYCQWLKNNHNWNQGMDNNLEAENECPNYLLVHHYHSRALAGWKPSPWEIEDEGVNAPRFNVAEMFYTDRPVDVVESGPIAQGSSIDDAYTALHYSRASMMYCAARLWLSKEEHKKVVQRAMAIMDDFEMEWAFQGRYNDEYAAPIMRAIMSLLRDSEGILVTFYKDFLVHLGIVLDCLGKRPEEGETFTAPDGSFSISYSQLALGTAHRETIKNGCSGALLVSPIILKRYQALKDSVMTAAQSKESRMRGEKRTRDRDDDDGPLRKRVRRSSLETQVCDLQLTR